MAKKKETKDLLTGKQKPQGWRDQFTDGQQEKEPAPATRQKSPPTYRRKTYLMTDELIQRIELQAEKAGREAIPAQLYYASLEVDALF